MMPCGQVIFQTCNVGFCHFLIARQAEQEGNVYVNALADGLPDSREAGFCTGDLDHYVLAVHFFPKFFRLFCGFFCFEGQEGRHFEAHITIGYTSYTVLVDQFFKVARGHDLAVDKIEPDALAETVYLFYSVSCHDILN